jgi:tetratricopeptide (TPR) repeat protein
MNHQKININRNFLFLFIILIAAILPYSNSFDASFQLDDFHTIQKSKSIADFNKFLDINSWKGVLYNRQIANLTFSINYLIGKYDVTGYHFFNLLIHIINSFLVFYFARGLFSTRALINSAEDKKAKYIPVFSALIFAVHPVQVQGVTYITQRMVSLAVLFYLLALIFYLIGRASNSKKSVIYFVLSIISLLLGIYCKEIIYSLPIAIIAVELFFIRDEKGSVNKRVLISLSAVTFLAALLFFSRFGFPKQPDAPDHWTYFLTQLHVLTIYIRLLFLPIGQHLYYLIPVAENFFTVNVLLGVIINGALLLFSILLFKNHRLISFGIVWFYITLSVESSFFPLKFLMFEYRLYPAIIGFSFVLVSGLFVLTKRFQINNSIIILVLIITVFGYLTYQHNEVWKDPITLWKNNVEQSPKNKEAHKNLGSELMTRNYMLEAFASFTKSIELDSNYAEPFAHRAVILSGHPNFESALRDANRAIKLDSTKALYFNNRGYVYQSVGDYQSAILDFHKSILLNKQYDNAMKNLSVSYYFINNYSEALKFADMSSDLDSSRGDYYNNRGNIYFALGNLVNAENDFRKAVELSPKYPKAINNLGVIKLKQNNFDEAIRYFTTALSIDNKFVDSYYYRAFSFINRNKMDLAYSDLIQCLRISPGHQGAQLLLNKYFK